MTEFNKLKRQFLDVFTTRIREFGFDKKKSISYYKFTETGKIAINLITGKSGDMLRVGLGGVIRIDKLKTVLDDFRTEVLNEKRISDFSFGSNIGNIRSGVYHQWHIYNETEISEIEEMFDIITREVLPYFEKYADPLRALEGLNDPEIGWKLDPFIEGRMDKALALTYVLNRYDLFVKQSSEGESAIMKYPYNPESRIKGFLQLRDWLNEKFREKDTSRENRP